MDISFYFRIVLLYLSVLHFWAPSPEPFKHSKSLGSLGPPSDCPKIGSLSGHLELNTAPCPPFPKPVETLRFWQLPWSCQISKKSLLQSGHFRLPKITFGLSGPVIVSENIILGSAGFEHWRMQGGGGGWQGQKPPAALYLSGAALQISPPPPR